MLADGVGFRKRRLSFSDSLIIQMRDQPVGRLPGFFIGFTHNHMQANTKAHLATMRCRFGAYLGNFLFDQLGRLTPGEVEIILFSRQILRHI